MYAFPNIKLPEKFIKEAGQKGLVPDAYYCTLLLEQTGICVVAGSGFRQKVNCANSTPGVLNKGRARSVISALKASAYSLMGLLGCNERIRARLWP